jgi:hypothetical protein
MLPPHIFAGLPIALAGDSEHLFGTILRGNAGFWKYIIDAPK